MIIDTGILVAAAARTDKNHDDAIRILRMRERKIVPEPVVVETAWYLGRHYGSRAESIFLRSLGRHLLSVEAVAGLDRERAAEILESYADARLGYVDASVMAIAERLGQTTIATLDRRDFSLVRPRHIDAFTLIP